MSQEFASPTEALEHFGVKGMKWGVRNNKDSKTPLTGLVAKPITRKVGNGDSITLSAHPPNKLIKGLAKISSNYKDSYNKSAYLDITDKDGKKIGSASLWVKNKDELYLNTIEISKSARGKGYATEILKAAGEHGKSMGMKRMILEVPGNAPDARHIYEKMGFTVTRELSPKGSDLWDGLTEMEYKFDDI